MRCDPLQVEALLFDELPVAKAAAVRSHLVRCAGCARLLEELRETRAGLSAARPGPERALAPLYPAIAARVDALRETRVVFRRMAVALTFACLLVLIGVPGLGRHSHLVLASSEDCGPSMCVQPATPVICEGDPEATDPIAAIEARYSACLIATPFAGR